MRFTGFSTIGKARRSRRYSRPATRIAKGRWSRVLAHDGLPPGPANGYADWGGGYHESERVCRCPGRRRTTRCRRSSGISSYLEPPPRRARAGACGSHSGAGPPGVRRWTVPSHDRGGRGARGTIVRRTLLRSPAFGRDLRKWLKSHVVPQSPAPRGGSDDRRRRPSSRAPRLLAPSPLVQSTILPPLAYQLTTGGKYSAISSS
jgi:hypothetical protein